MRELIHDIDMRELIHDIDMRELIHDIADDPREYLPVFLFAAGLLAVWGGLCVTAIFSLRGIAPRDERAPARLMARADSALPGLRGSLGADSILDGKRGLPTEL